MDATAFFRSGLCALALSACATRPPARSVVDGTLRYRASARAVDAEQAILQAEGAALEDLANECSMIPNTTTIERRATGQTGYENKAAAIVKVPLNDCMRARPTLDPASVRALADPDLTARLKRYQDLQEMGKAGPVSVKVPEDLPVAPDRDSHWDDTEYYYVLRQTLAYQKQIPVLAPAGAFASLTDARRFIASVEPVEALLRAMQANNPSLRTKPLAWSEMKDPLRVTRPECLRRERQ